MCVQIAFSLKCIQSVSEIFIASTTYLELYFITNMTVTVCVHDLFYDVLLQSARLRLTKELFITFFKSFICIVGESMTGYTVMASLTDFLLKSQ